MALLTARDIMDQTCSVNATTALEEINRYLRRQVNRGRGETFYDIANIVDVNTTFTDTEEHYIRKVLDDAGWTCVSFNGTKITFYFPS